MAEHHLIAVYTALRSALSGNTSAGTRVYAESIPEGVARPYLFVRQATGVQRHFHRDQDPEVIVDVKAVANDWATAASIAQAAGELLDAQGEQDGAGLSGGTDWYLLKAMREGDIFQQYFVGTEQVYEEGFQLRIILQEK